MSRIARPETLTEAVANHIKNAIIAGEYAPGSALPEVPLASELGTSRGTVREALRALADEGLVDVFHHRGSFVSTITTKKASETYDLRLILEPHAVGLAFDSGALHTPELRGQMDARLAEMRAAAKAKDLLAMISAERELHRLLWWPCDNDILREVLSNLLVQTRRMLAYTKPFERDLSREYEDHRILVGTLSSTTRDQLLEAVRQHLLASKAVVLGKMNAVTQIDP
jgi:DNA-binding GntR family transcriptional regulator